MPTSATFALAGTWGARRPASTECTLPAIAGHRPSPPVVDQDLGAGLLPWKSCDHGRIEPPVERPGENEDQPRPRRFDAWRRRSAIGAIATGVALGLKEIFQPTNVEPVITSPAPGDPPDADERLRVILHPDDPTKSVAILPKSTGTARTRSVDGPGGWT
jgi:hypothetical protein